MRIKAINSIVHIRWTGSFLKLNDMSKTQDYYWADLLHNSAQQYQTELLNYEQYENENYNSEV